MIGETFKAGDLVRILTLEEMMETLHCSKTDLYDDYDVVAAMHPYCGETVVIEQARKPASENRYLEKHDPDGWIYSLEGNFYNWYSWTLTNAKEIDLSDWSSLFDGGGQA